MACTSPASKEEVFSQVTDYDSVLRDDHDKSSWEKVSREPSAIRQPSAVATPGPKKKGDRTENETKPTP